MQQGSALLSLDETTPQMLREAITDSARLEAGDLVSCRLAGAIPSGVRC